MKQSDKQKRLADIQALQDIQNFEANLNRARSVTVGTAFGGTTEVSLRGNDGKTLWCLLQPVEVIELIHQLAANVGCHINLQPRRDFSRNRRRKTAFGGAPTIFQRHGSAYASRSQLTPA
jgi:hypothetical protein